MVRVLPVACDAQSRPRVPHLDLAFWSARLADLPSLPGRPCPPRDFIAPDGSSKERGHLIIPLTIDGDGFIAAGRDLLGDADGMLWSLFPRTRLATPVWEAAVLHYLARWNAFTQNDLWRYEIWHHSQCVGQSGVLRGEQNAWRLGQAEAQERASEGRRTPVQKPLF